MNKENLKDLLGQLGVSQADFARLLDVTPRTVNLWLAGTRPVPGPVTAYVGLLMSLPVGMQQAELARVGKKGKAMRDGMYLIEFVGAEGAGAGTLVFDGGRIFGSDGDGGNYDGSYEYNEGTGLIDVRVRVEMLAGYDSVIGPAQPFDWALDVWAELQPEQMSGEFVAQTNLQRPIQVRYRHLRDLPVAA